MSQEHPPRSAQCCASFQGAVLREIPVTSAAASLEQSSAHLTYETLLDAARAEGSSDRIVDDYRKSFVDENDMARAIGANRPKYRPVWERMQSKSGGLIVSSALLPFSSHRSGSLYRKQYLWFVAVMALIVAAAFASPTLALKLNLAITLVCVWSVARSLPAVR